MSIDFTKCRVSKSGNIITPKGRLSFPQVFTAKKAPGADKEKFSTSLLIPPTADLALMAEAVKKCIAEKWGDKAPAKLKKPFLKAEDFEYEGYEKGWVLIRPTSLQKPGLVDASGKNVVDESEVYPGRWACLSLRAFAYDANGSRGVAFGLQNIQLLDHDEPIGGRARAEDEFEPADMPSEGSKWPLPADSLFD